MLDFSEKTENGDGSLTDGGRGQLAAQVWTLLVDHVTASVTDRFESQGIESLLLKGAAFAQLLYERHWERLYTDTDLLVQARDHGRAEQCLCDLGFARIDRDADWIEAIPKYSHTFRRLTDGAVVDLHWRLAGAAASPEQQWSTVSARTASLEVSGRPVVVLDATASAFLVALHNAHHGTRRPQTLIDLAHAIDRVEFSAWCDAARLAQDLGADEPFAAGLRLSSAGDALADRLGLVRPASIDMWLKTNPASYGTRVLHRATHPPTLRAGLRICVRVVVPPRVVMYRFFPLAQRGRAGLALAYILRPLRLIAHAAPAIRGWMRAQRALRATHARPPT